MHPVAQKAKGTLGGVWKSIGSRTREVILPFLSVGEATSGVLCPALGFPV